MSDTGGQASPGWYPDPYQPTRLRYWDGTQWTEHYHDDAPSGSLPSVGDWFGSTFSAIGADGIPALALAVAGSLAVNLSWVVLLNWAITDQAVIDERFVGSWASLVTRLGVLAVVVGLLQAWVWLAVNRFMQRAHRQADPSVAEAVIHAVGRMPRLIGVWLVVIVPLFVVIALILGAAALTQIGSVVALASLVLIPITVWVFVKFSFLPAAVVAAPTSTSALRASMSVSSGRFWPVLGRLLLVSIGMAVVSGMAAAALGEVGSPIDQEAFADIVIVEGDVVSIRDFTFRQLLPGTGTLVGYVIVNSVLNAATVLVSTSAFMRLYLDSGAPSDL